MSRAELFFDSDVTTPVTVHVHTHASTSSLSGLVQGPVTTNHSEARNFRVSVIFRQPCFRQAHQVRFSKFMVKFHIGLRFVSLVSYGLSIPKDNRRQRQSIFASSGSQSHPASPSSLTGSKVTEPATRKIELSRFNSTCVTPTE